jgi:exopolysaccharide production protein ExoQ
VALIATLICGLCIFWLFRLVRDPKERPSKAIWIPVLWLFIAGSRPVSLWLDDAPTQTGADSYYNGSALEASVYQCLIIAGLIVLIRRKPQLVAALRSNWPIIAYFAYCLLSSYWSSFTYISAKRWTKAMGDPVMVLIMLTEREPLTAAKRVITRTGFFLFPLSILMIEAYPESGTAPGSLMTAPMVVGITTGKNELGMICLIWGLGLLWCLMDSFRRRRERPKGWIAYAAVFAMAAWLVNLCNSATSLSCLLLGSALLVMTNLRFVTRRPVVVHCLVFALLSVAVVAIFVAPTLLSTVGRDSTLTGRAELWPIVLGMVGNPLIGTGYESFWLGWRLDRMWKLYWWHPIESHEGYIETYLNLGWIGIALLTVIVLRGYSRVVGDMRRDRDMSNLKLAYIVAALVFNLTESAFHYVNPVWIMLLFATTVAPAVSISNDHPPLRIKHAAKDVGDDGAHLWFNPDSVLKS